MNLVFESNIPTPVIPNEPSLPSPHYNYCMVYQHYYVNAPATGFGDFIRGIYFMLQFARQYGLKIDFLVNKHPIKKWISYFSLQADLDSALASSIPFIDTSNYKYHTNSHHMIDYVYKHKHSSFQRSLAWLPSHKQNKYMYTTDHPNQRHITKEDISQARAILEPTKEMQQMVNDAMNQLDITSGRFVTIHVRTTDQCFSGTTCNTASNSMRGLVKWIQKIIQFHTSAEIVLLSSDNRVKTAVQSNCPKIKYLIYPISHVGTKQSSDVGIINTLKDFYIMSHSSHIYSFSAYDHGSGFSKWCALTYDIPYVCYSMQKIAKLSFK